MKPKPVVFAMSIIMKGGKEKLSAGKADGADNVRNERVVIFLRFHFLLGAGMQMAFQHLAARMFDVSFHGEQIFQYMRAVFILLDHRTDFLRESFQAFESVQ